MQDVRNHNSSRSLEHVVVGAFALSALLLWGCTSFSDGPMPPGVDVPESFAVPIIIDEANRNGLPLSTDPKELAVMHVGFEADAVDLAHNVAVEYLGPNDCLMYTCWICDAGVIPDVPFEPWDAPPSFYKECINPNQADLPGFERRVMRDRPGVRVRLFSCNYASSLESAEADLRAQVRAFVAELREQGIL